MTQQRFSDDEVKDLIERIKGHDIIVKRLSQIIGKLNASRNEWRDRYRAVTRGADIVHGDDFDPVDADIDPIGDLHALCAMLVGALDLVKDMVVNCPDAPRDPGSLPQHILATVRDALKAAEEMGVKPNTTEEENG